MADVKTWTDGVTFDANARKQVDNVASLPFVFRHVAVMPDVHWGIGATVGSVIPTRGAIIPAAVGVDIGCGMMATQTTLRATDLPDSLSSLRASIERSIPVGNGPGGEHRDPPPRIDSTLRSTDLAGRLDAIVRKHPKIRIDKMRAQLGTLGGGNHFVEVCLDESDRVWVMLHSGSRGTGNMVGTYFIERAREQLLHRVLGYRVPDRDLAFLAEGEPLFDDYIEAVSWAQDYARANRDVMMARALDAMRRALRPFELTSVAVNCHHNYVERETHFGERVWITRKGAVRARDGELGIVPGSMGARSYIVRGRGNVDSFHSCSHGAGRRMSRGQAKKAITLADHAAATAGVECRKDEGVLDESPAAYKDIDAVMAAQTDLVEIVHTLKQVICIKG
jgi:tRNA-splicing ligase RtcB